MRYLLKDIPNERIINIIKIIGSLVLGFLIYACFRDNSIFYLGVNMHYAPDWLVYNLPDGLWTYSMTVFILALWDKHDLNNYIWNLIPLFLSLSYELSQLILDMGTFDLCDILFSVIFYCLAIRTKFNTFLHKKYTYG